MMIASGNQLPLTRIERTKEAQYLEFLERPQRPIVIDDHTRLLANAYLKKKLGQRQTCK